jgi:hypothetical protein
VFRVVSILGCLGGLGSVFLGSGYYYFYYFDDLSMQHALPMNYTGKWSGFEGWFGPSKLIFASRDVCHPDSQVSLCSVAL